MDSPEAGVSWNKRDFCVALLVVSACSTRQWEGEHTQREPEKSISKTTFWWLVYTKEGVSTEETRAKTKIRI